MYRNKIWCDIVFMVFLCFVGLTLQFDREINHDSEKIPNIRKVNKPLGIRILVEKVLLLWNKLHFEQNSRESPPVIALVVNEALEIPKDLTYSVSLLMSIVKAYYHYGISKTKNFIWKACRSLEYVMSHNELEEELQQQIIN